MCFDVPNINYVHVQMRFESCSGVEDSGSVTVPGNHPCSLYGKEQLGYISPLCFTEENI